MIRIIFISIVCLITFSACRKDGISCGTPSCVVNKINDFKKDACKDANVKEYKFQGKTVYVFDPGTCGADMTSEVIDSDCTTQGYLGGFASNTIINGCDFSTANCRKTVWKK